MTLPVFNYHPDPVATGSIKASDEVCGCCGKARGYSYQKRMYAVNPPEVICPWCISDGSCAEKFEGMFCDSYPLIEAGVPGAIIDEVTKRTPSFASWQEEVWLSHCGDACEFHGDVSKKEMHEMSLPQFQAAFHDDTSLNVAFMKSFAENYEPGGNPAIYKWICRKCGEVRYYADFT